MPDAAASLAHPDLPHSANGTNVATPRRAGFRRAFPVLIGVTATRSSYAATKAAVSTAITTCGLGSQAAFWRLSRSTSSQKNTRALIIAYQSAGSMSRRQWDSAVGDIGR